VRLKEFGRVQGGPRSGRPDETTSSEPRWSSTDPGNDYSSGRRWTRTIVMQVRPSRSTRTGTSQWVAPCATGPTSSTTSPQRLRSATAAARSRTSARAAISPRVYSVPGSHMSSHTTPPHLCVVRPIAGPAPNRGPRRRRRSASSLGLASRRAGARRSPAVVQGRPRHTTVADSPSRRPATPSRPGV